LAGSISMKFNVLPILATTLTLLSATTLSALAQTATIQAHSGSRVNVRQYPSTSSAIQHYGLGGDRVDILERTNAPDGALWYLVKFPNSGARGWIRGDLIRVDGESPGSGSVQRLSFAPGTSGATVGGQVQGSQYQDYLLNARAGQTITAGIIGNSPHIQMQVFAPNGSNLYTGSANWSKALPSNGDYRLRIRIVPEEQQSGTSGQYSLTVSIR
jgi:hypothetical protein